MRPESRRVPQFRSRGSSVRVPVSPSARKPLNVELNPLAHELLGFFEGRPGNTQSGKIGGISAPARSRLLEDNRVSPHSRPAGPRILLSVPFATSTEGCLATGTLPDFWGCLYCRWLPLLGDEVPAISFNQMNHIANFHATCGTVGFTISSTSDSAFNFFEQG